MKNNNLQTDQYYFNAHILQFNLNESGNSGIDTLSRVLSVKIGFINYFQFINFAFITKSSKILPGRHKEYPTTIKEEKLWFYPNPAADFCIIEYTTKSLNANTYIQIIDIEGRKIKDLQLNKSSDLVLLRLNDISIGVYLIQLVENGVITATQKLIRK